MRLCEAVTTLYCFLATVHSVFGQLQPPAPTLNAKERKLGPCQSCKVFVESFERGLESTARGKHEGGDAAWEEEKLRSYARSELRLVEIQEGLCSIKANKEQCLHMAEQAEDAVEVWWFTDEPKKDLFHWLCIDKLQHCCPKKHFGKNCKPCSGAPDNVCSNNGKCKGEGTRSGNGLCICDLGYDGLDCGRCNISHYESFRSEDKLLCSPCHKSCRDACSQAGPKGCALCADGWLMDSEAGCVDVDECLTSQCGNNEFCVNSQGSYACLLCDKSCDGCSGDGPDMCDKCAKDYRHSGGVCIDAESEYRAKRITFTRYLTYLGLCIATCIIFQKSTYLAAAVGILVASYMSVSEYLITNLYAGSETGNAFF